MAIHGPVARLQCMLDDYVDNFGAIGALVGIDIPGADRVRVVAGERSRGGDLLSPTDFFQIGSQTKTFVALAMMLLARDGAVSLDDPVHHHLDLAIDPRVTLRHLIMNTSGIPEYLGLTQGKMAGEIAPEDLIAPALAQPLLFTPGDRFDYTNSGWVIAAMVLDAQAPGGYAGFVRDRIFGPLAMHDSHLGDGYATDRLFVGSMGTSDGRVASASDALSLSWGYGAGDIISSCDDMLTFYRALSRPDNALGLSFEDMTGSWAEASETPAHPTSLGGSYALGLERRYWGGTEVWGHPGRTAGCGAATWYAPACDIIVTTAACYVQRDEPPALSALRYNAHLLFTQALTTAHALADLSAVDESAHRALAVT